ncbi:amidase signature enzyme [Rickenella mellea]|uniref:Amidase signature enzyme n=1 Tax=Rickenella mellea TaxID=50990 RepID=A0A4Y7QJ84_9AGAM|nr:amidase signature enzyme [Rickenella mellea]
MTNGESATKPENKYANLPDLYEASILDLQEGLQNQVFTSVELVKAYFSRIEEVNHQGPKLNAVIETNPSALTVAAQLDDERKRKSMRSALHGIPVLLKDNIATLHEEGMNTTAGSFALLGSVVPCDAGVASRLRDAGAIILGKANLSEWGNYRGTVPSGFSGRGGQATNPYYPLADPSGSSSGCAIAAAIGLAAGALGTETDGSIISPCSRQNVVGIKPTVGLTSRAGVIPISSHQDSVGPICRTVADAAVILSIIAGRDPRDGATLSQPDQLPNYTEALNPHALRGARIGVPRLFQDDDAATIVAFNEAIEIIKELGATIVDPADFPNASELRNSKSEHMVMTADFKVDLNKYLAGLQHVPTGVKNLADIIQFNIDHADKELIPPFYADQSQMITSQASTLDETYFDALKANEELGGTGGIDATLKKYNLDALILPSDAFVCEPAAMTGYPIISVPMGFHPHDIEPSPATPTVSRAPGIPFGISFYGTAFSEFKLIGYAYAYEQRTQHRLKRHAYAEAVPKTQLKDVIGK